MYRTIVSRSRVEQIVSDLIGQGVTICRLERRIIGFLGSENVFEAAKLSNGYLLTLSNRVSLVSLSSASDKMALIEV